MKKLRITAILAAAFACFTAICAVTQIDLTTQVKGVLASANGGTASAFFGVTGPTAARTYTFPDASATVLTGNAAVTVAQGGLGQTSLTAHGMIVGEGSTVTVVGPGTSNYCWLSNGASADPSWQVCPGNLNLAFNETPGGTINGVNAAFTVANTPVTGTLMVFKNGQLMTGSGADYTLSGTTATFVSGAIPKTGDVLLALYRY
jgi:hypothetical protein